MPRPHAANSTARTPRILLVSAMFPLPASKHSAEDYAFWLEKFLGHIETDVYFFAPPTFAPTVRSSRPTSLLITIDTTYPTPFDVPPLNGLETQYEAMHSKDREAFRHNPSLYAVWNAKPWLLNQAVEKMRERGEVYDYAFWSDAGSFRGEHAYRAWPDPARVHEVMDAGDAKDDRIFIPLTGVHPRTTRFWVEQQGPIDAEVSEGSFFGGAPAAISWYMQTFYAYHNYYLSLGLFVGKDQTLINALLLLFPDHFSTVYYRDALAPAHTRWPVLLPYFDAGFLGACGSEWYYYHFFLANEEEREHMRDMWIRDEANRRAWAAKWAGWIWWTERQRCRVTRSRNFEDILRDTFGNDWRPPQKLIEIS
ncbi:hypothetical protein BDN70DRAFT_796517 [Pholiota conissans]|uniref:Uncharacterized protein n=1 Tax=Pholiota conissans TaxID=109636 RepID=A0A9P5ZC95_9AGAR|nr:hypothetical protein BDN70DRAFT_796517 [Pholiota conissans]